MKFKFDAAKNERNIRERGIPFELAADFDWESALVVPSDRRGEARYFALGFIGAKLHALAFTKRGQNVRVTSLRRANKKEAERYEKAKP